MASGDVVLKTSAGCTVAVAYASPDNRTWRVELNISDTLVSVPSTSTGYGPSNVSSVINGAVTAIDLSVANNGPDALSFDPTKTYDITITEH
jgi:hypothetical protein